MGANERKQNPSEKSKAISFLAASGMEGLGVNSIGINFGPKMGPRCQIENWPIGRQWQAFTHWQNWPENWHENWPENWPEIFCVI